jgi:mono/diheme cytochrome c family protein
MLKTPMPPEWARLVASYLAGSEARAGRAERAERVEEAGTAGLTGVATATVSLAEIQDSAALYARACAACHGDRGGGDGVNAPNLPVRPTAHADSAYMSTRPDDTLFDGIYGGGYILNKSARMPAFGATLTREQIWGLVHYLRVLCRCQDPAWSRS